MLRYVVCIFIIGVQAYGIEPVEEPVSSSIHLTLPNISWSLEIDDPNLILFQKETTRNGKQSKFFAKDTQSGIQITGFLETRPKPGTPNECREFYKTFVKQSPFKMDKMVEYDLGKHAILEYMVNEFNGISVHQKHMHAYLTQDRFWIDIHLSKTSFQEEEKGRFISIVQNLRIVPKKREKPVKVSYGISDEGVLRFEMLGTWNDEIRQKPQGRSIVDITLTPSSDGSAKVLISVIWSRRHEVAFNTTQKLKKYVESMGRKALSQSVENALIIREFPRGPSCGYYFSLTDKAPKPGEYKYLTQGSYNEGKCLLIFTILSNTKDGNVVQTALDMLAGSELVINGIK